MFVYFIRSGNGKSAPIKIGIAQNPEKRITELQTGNPNPLLLLCKAPVNSRKQAEFLERELHNYFSYCRMEGEWFRGDKVNIHKALNSINFELEGEMVASKVIKGSKKEEKIIKLQTEINKLKKTMLKIETEIDDELDLIHLSRTSGLIDMI